MIPKLIHSLTSSHIHHSLTHPSISSRIHSHTFIHSFTHPLFPHTFLPSFLQTLISTHSFISSHTHQFLHAFTPSHSFTPSPIIPSHIHQFFTFSPSLIHSFIRPLFPHNSFIPSHIPSFLTHSFTLSQYMLSRLRNLPQKCTFSQPHSLTHPCIHLFPGSEREFIPTFTPSLPPSSRILPPSSIESYVTHT